MRIALASPPIPSSIADGLDHVRAYTADAARRGAAIVCFPEAYLPGLRGQDFDVPDWSAADEERATIAVRAIARASRIAMIVGVEHVTPAGSQIASLVVDAHGAVLGLQTKNQLDPSEDAPYIPGDTRRVFEFEGLRFGIAICHEGWRYPETVRWAAARGAHIVFHPQLTGSDRTGPRLTTWGDVANPYYEKAMLMRSRENTIWFASVNYGVRFQESATTVINPLGELHAHLPYGEPGVLIVDIDRSAATGLLARRYAPERYREG
ncbi:MAG: carbon-nitrogen hydrolase family protein [Gemmatimonadetes bacterium]|nr:carbon-nitrogen hydrolase family protein [Gemmatimonadota bacterium]